MCTLILAWRVFDDAPVAAAANRDELYDRPARPPSGIDDNPVVVAPQDEQAGGTWIGYNEHGLFVAVTNRRSDLEGDRSRGLLVRDALARETAEDAVQYVERELDARAYAGFNLVVADATSATVLEWDGALERTDFDPGVHVVVNAGVDDAADKAHRIRDAATVAAGETVGDWSERMEQLLADHDIGACVHGDGFGTRSSSIVRIDESKRGTYRFADGSPCQTPYREIQSAEGQI